MLRTNDTPNQEPTQTDKVVDNKPTDERHYLHPTDSVHPMRTRREDKLEEEWLKNPVLEKRTQDMAMRTLESSPAADEAKTEKASIIEQQKVVPDSASHKSEKTEASAEHHENKANLSGKSKSSTSSGFFEKSIPIYLIYPFSSTIDFKKIDARINTKPDIEEADCGLEVAGCLLHHRWISVPKSCHKEIIEKLKNHSDIFVIDGSKTSAWDNYFKTTPCPFSRNP